MCAAWNVSESVSVCLQIKFCPPPHIKIHLSVWVSPICYSDLYDCELPVLLQAAAMLVCNLNVFSTRSVSLSVSQLAQPCWWQSFWYDVVSRSISASCNCYGFMIIISISSGRVVWRNNLSHLGFCKSAICPTVECISSCAKKAKVRYSLYCCLHESRSALQSREWQMIGVS